MRNTMAIWLVCLLVTLCGSQHEYTFSTKLVDSLSYGHDTSEIQEDVSTSKFVQNLDSMLKLVGTDKCLIVVNKFLGSEIEFAVSLPVILRRFGIAKVIKTSSTSEPLVTDVWTPQEHLFKLNGNYKSHNEYEIPHNCHISELFTPLSSDLQSSGYCVGLNPDRFSSFSKPWLCEVQVDLFMPEMYFTQGKITQIFRYYNHTFKISTTMPKLNILVDTYKVIRKYDFASKYY